jgi:hypothetical protein
MSCDGWSVDRWALHLPLSPFPNGSNSFFPYEHISLSPFPDGSSSSSINNSRRQDVLLPLFLSLTLLHHLIPPGPVLRLPRAVGLTILAPRAAPLHGLHAHTPRSVLKKLPNNVAEIAPFLFPHVFLVLLILSLSLSSLVFKRRHYGLDPPLSTPVSTMFSTGLLPSTASAPTLHKSVSKKLPRCHRRARLLPISLSISSCTCSDVLL